ncbi:MAG: gliding motility-associated C-terminal domain-containing protein [Bacteroidales bacterium]|nr:gliding motility-associated C-terminal domain-containing protein [Bacteroidales bacterium]
MKRLLKIFLIISSVLTVAPLHGQVDFNADRTSGCSPLAVKLSLDSTTIPNFDTIRNFRWQIGYYDIYEERYVEDTLPRLPRTGVPGGDPDTLRCRMGGTYTISLFINYNNSVDTVIKTDYIDVSHRQSAEFGYRLVQDNSIFEFSPSVIIFDSSKTYNYQWRFKNITTYDSATVNVPPITSGDKNEAAVSEDLDQSLNVTTESASLIEVRLRIRDSDLCRSQAIDTIIVYDDLEIPNAFAPDVQNYFIINPIENITGNDITAIYDVVLLFEVYTRYGIKVYSSTAPKIAWDGKNNEGRDLNTGVYYYTLKAIEGDDSGKYTKSGFIHLFRQP